MVQFVGQRVPRAFPGPPRKYLTEEIQRELRLHPGEYAPIAEDVPRGAVRAINKHDGFHAITRTVNGKIVLYAKSTI